MTTALQKEPSSQSSLTSPSAETPSSPARKRRRRRKLARQRPEAGTLDRTNDTAFRRQLGGRDGENLFRIRHRTRMNLVKGEGEQTVTFQFMQSQLIALLIPCTTQMIVNLCYLMKSMLASVAVSRSVSFVMLSMVGFLMLRMTLMISITTTIAPSLAMPIIVS